MATKKSNTLNALLLAITALSLVVATKTYLENSKVKTELNKLTDPTKQTWVSFALDGSSYRAAQIDFPHGWTVQNINSPRQYWFESPEIKQINIGNQLITTKGAWISFTWDKAHFGETLTSLEKRIKEGNFVKEVKATKFLDHDAVWYLKSENISGTLQNTVSIDTIIGNNYYRLVLIYNPGEPNSERYDYVFNEMARRMKPFLQVGSPK